MTADPDPDDDDDEARAALRAIHHGEAELDDVLTLIHAAIDSGRAWAPERLIAAADALDAIRGDLANGGLDQVVWNHGPEAAEGFAAAFSAVGAVELAALLGRLAAALREVRGESDEGSIAADPVAGFLNFRRRVGGPDFDVVDPDVEVGEALLEAAIEGARDLADADGPAPPLRVGIGPRQ